MLCIIAAVGLVYIVDCTKLLVAKSEALFVF